MQSEVANPDLVAKTVILRLVTRNGRSSTRVSAILPPPPTKELIAMLRNRAQKLPIKEFGTQTKRK